MQVFEGTFLDAVVSENSGKLRTMDYTQII